MTYDFTSILAREGKDSIAANHIPIPGAVVREGFSRIPMWVADMSFPTAPEIVNAMRKRVVTVKKGVIISDEEKGEYIDED